MKNETYIIISMAALSLVSLFIPYTKELPLCMTMLGCTFWIVKAIESKNEK